MAAAGARSVFMKAWTAMPSAASAEPALKPNQPNHRMPVPRSVHGQGVGRHRVGAVALAGAEHEEHGDRRGTGVDVDHRAAGEVERAHLGQPAAAEHGVGERRVHEDQPDPAEQRPGAELHAVGDGAGDQRRGDDRERHLEGGEQERPGHDPVGGDRHRCRSGRCRRTSRTSRRCRPCRRRSCSRSATTSTAIRPMQKKFCMSMPRKFFAADHAAVEERQARRHEQHEGRGDQDPGDVALHGMHLSTRSVLTGAASPAADFSSMTRMFRCRELVGQIRIENAPTSRQMDVRSPRWRPNAFRAATCTGSHTGDMGGAYARSRSTTSASGQPGGHGRRQRVDAQPGTIAADQLPPEQASGHRVGDHLHGDGCRAREVAGAASCSRCARTTTGNPASSASASLSPVRAISTSQMRVMAVPITPGNEA